MGYQAILFCPEEKTARTVKQVLSELDFSVESCTEPFAAVKKLMAERFDAIVVDCENEQNATLLFKSARNSASNQGSLAVAVVEGQAGVAKAFRIGANLVLTKPINVEQAKGTLRVARGLLRKGEAGKTSVAASAAPVPGEAATKRATAAAAPSQSRAEARLKPFPTEPVVPSIAANVASAASGGDDDNVFDMEEPAPASVGSGNSGSPEMVSKAGVPVSKSEVTSGSASKPYQDLSASSAATASITAAAGTAAAPARSPEKSEPIASSKADAKVTELFEKTAPSDATSTSAPLPGPSFSFGGVTGEEEPSAGGLKKALIGAGAAAVVAIGAYVGWSQLHGKSSAPVETGKPEISAPAVADQKPAAPKAPARPVADISSPSSALPEATGHTTPRKSVEEAPESASHASEKSASSKPSAKIQASEPPEESSFNPAPATQPIVVKNGAKPSSRAASAASDTAAPSVIGIAPSSSGGSLSDVLGDTSEGSKPVLQTLNVSQGVSQGLLVKKVQPTYPPSAIRMHLEGAVQLMATISKTGNISAVKIVSGEPLLAQAAADAVKQWKYKPYYLNGDPVEIQTQVTINFKLPK